MLTVLFLFLAAAVAMLLLVPSNARPNARPTHRQLRNWLKTHRIAGAAETKVSKSPDVLAQFPAYTESADGAIGIQVGSVHITKGTAAALTLALPTDGTDDGKILEIIDETGAAHTVTTPTNGVNGNHHILTFDGTVGAIARLVARGGTWWGGRQTGITIS